jgi:hypothetical protein
MCKDHDPPSDRPPGGLSMLLRDARPTPPSDDDQAAVLHRLNETLGTALGTNDPSASGALWAACDGECSRVA